MTYENWSRNHFTRQPNHTDIEGTLIGTGLGFEACTLTLHNKMAQLYYFYSCVGILLFVNVGFFCCTVMCLRARQRETEVAHNQSTAAKAKGESDMERLVNLTFIVSHHQHFMIPFFWDFSRLICCTSNVNRFQLFTRLFFIMGVLWIFELVSWICELANVSENLKQMFVFTDCLNALQGAFIFILFVWKRRIGKQLSKKCALTSEQFRRRSQSTLRSTTS